MLPVSWLKTALRLDGEAIKYEGSKIIGLNGGDCMNELTQYFENLPVTIDGLKQYVTVGIQRHQAHLAAIKAIEGIPEAKEVKEKTYDKTMNDLIETWIAHAKLGELIFNITGGIGGGIQSTTGGSERILPEGINKDDSRFARGFHAALTKGILESSINELEEKRTIPAYYNPYHLNIKDERAEELKKIHEMGINRRDDICDVIITDPPWPYDTQHSYDAVGFRGTTPYPELSIEQIKNDFPQVSKDCVLWLWTTHRFMRDSFYLLDEWGFREVSIITWDKEKIGIGRWLRSQSEFCIMAVKGKPKVRLTNQSTIIREKGREHSRKPEAFYKLVNELCIGKVGECYSREKRPGIIRLLYNEDKYEVGTGKVSAAEQG